MTTLTYLPTDTFTILGMSAAVCQYRGSQCRCPVESPEWFYDKQSPTETPISASQARAILQLRGVNLVPEEEAEKPDPSTDSAIHRHANPWHDVCKMLDEIVAERAKAASAKPATRTEERWEVRTPSSGGCAYFFTRDDAVRWVGTDKTLTTPRRIVVQVAEGGAA